MKKLLRNTIILFIGFIIMGLTFAYGFDYLTNKRIAKEENKKAVKEVNVISEKKVEKLEVNKKSGVSSANQIFNDVKTSVVSVTVEGQIGFESNSQTVQSGSGVIYAEDDKYFYIITNAHVIKENPRVSSPMIYVNLEGGKKNLAKSLGMDEDTDLAVLSVEKNKDNKNYTVAKLGKSSELQVGETVMPVGNALGYGQSITRGIVSAVDRDIAGISKYAYKLIQTDAAINPGNSGGALVNSKSEVIGINTVKIADTKVEGVGFAIPIEAAKEISDTIREKGFLPKAYIGVQVQNLDASLIEYYSLPKGVYINEVFQSSPAEKAGLKRGDIILSINGEKTLTAQILSNLIRSQKKGDEIKAEIYREGKIYEAKITLEESTKE